MSHKYDVLVTDANQRVALEIVRSLGLGEGLRILAVELDENSKKPLAAASRFCSDFSPISNYYSDDFISLCDLCKVIIPVSTNTIIQCCDRAVKKYPDRFLLPSITLFRKINDKFLLSEKAAEIGVEYPKSILISNIDVLKETAGDIGFPLIIKLCNDEGLFLSPSERYQIVNSKSELDCAWDVLSRHNKNLLVQEYIKGCGVAFSALYDRNHHCVISFQHKRLREYPINGGPSTYCQSIFQQNIEDAGRKILDNLRWVGPAMVEFKYDADTDRLVLIEINPRYWGSLPLARKSGINIPAIHYRLVHGEVGQIEKYRKGVKVKFFITDLIAVLKEIHRSRSYILGLWKYIFELFDLKLSLGIWMLRDPLPALRYFINHFYNR